MDTAPVLRVRSLIFAAFEAVLRPRETLDQIAPSNAVLWYRIEADASGPA